MAGATELTELLAGTPIVFGGNRVLRVDEKMAAAFVPGDSVVVVEQTEELLLIPSAERKIARAAVGEACRAFEQLSRASDAQISAFYTGFADRLEDDSVWAAIMSVNDADVASAQKRGRSTTRLVANAKLRGDMIAGLRGWVNAPSRRGQVIESVEHDDWRAELVGAALGVVGFIFEGRPNVVADATGVLRGGNAVVLRIGSDALGTARCIMEQALHPALQAAQLPTGAVTLVDSSTHASSWALFGDNRLSLAVARGSGATVATLGAIAQQAGIPVSLHGTGGAWIVAAEGARPDAFRDAVVRSLDRKVCNTLNTCCIVRGGAAALVPALLDGMAEAGARLGQGFKLHVVEGDEAHIPAELLSKTISVRRAGGDVEEMQAETIPVHDLGREWEWEQTPEVTLKIVDDVDDAVTLFNRHSPQFIACLIDDDAAAQQHFYETVNAPFVGEGYTRWVDGQFALGRPELGLSNWQWGRLFGRGGILSGDTVYTVRTRARGKARPSKN